MTDLHAATPALEDPSGDGSEAGPDPASGPQDGAVRGAVQRAVDAARFPLRLRGYDPAAVDAHLEELARTAEPGIEPAPPTTSAPGDPSPAAVAEHSFRLVRKGFDPEEVRDYLRSVAGLLATRPAVAAAGAPPDRSDTADGADHPEPDDPDRAAAVAPPADPFATVADQVAAVLASAEHAAAEIVARAQAKADDLHREAEPRARALLDELLADQRAELVRTQAELREAHEALRSMHATLGRTLAELDDRPPAPGADLEDERREDEGPPIPLLGDA